MKKIKYFILLFLLSQFFASGLGAQTSHYFPLQEKNAEWIQQEEDISPDNGDTTFRVFFLETRGDTTINGIKHIHLRGHFFNDTLFEFADYYFYQDTINKKVYYYSYAGAKPGDTLLYDFSLHVGDTLKNDLYSGNSTDYFYISSIDSILIGNNYHRRLNIADVKGLLYPVAWIEGIGSTGALFDNPYFFYPPIFFPAKFTMVCVQIDSQFVYSVPNYWNLLCDSLQFVTLGINDPHALLISEVAIYPNPASEQIQVLVNRQLPENYSIEVYSAEGEKVYSDAFMSREGKIISVRSFPQGIYVCKVKGREGFVALKEFVIH